MSFINIYSSAGDLIQEPHLVKPCFKRVVQLPLPRKEDDPRVLDYTEMAADRKLLNRYSIHKRLSNETYTDLESSPKARAS